MKTKLGLFIILIVLFTVGCAAPEPEVATVKVLTLPYHSFSPFYIAIEEGYFAELGTSLYQEFVQGTPG